MKCKTAKEFARRVLGEDRTAVSRRVKRANGGQYPAWWPTRTNGKEWDTATLLPRLLKAGVIRQDQVDDWSRREAAAKDDRQQESATPAPTTALDLKRQAEIRIRQLDLEERLGRVVPRDLLSQFVDGVGRAVVKSSQRVQGFSSNIPSLNETQRQQLDAMCARYVDALRDEIMAMAREALSGVDR